MLRAIVSIVGLLVVVLVVMSLAKKQVGAVMPAAGPAAPAAAPATQAQRAAQELQRAMEQGAAARASEAGQ